MIDREPENPSILSSHMSASGIRYETDVTLRDLFAAKVAAQGYGMNLKNGTTGPEAMEAIADDAYLLADAMLKRRAL